MPQRGQHRRRWRFLLATFCLVPSLVHADDIFRYQDEHGNWHFTDDPPTGYETTVVPDIKTSISSSNDSETVEDLAARLESEYRPSTPIELATLAVVSIKTDLLEGSGFFCSDQGHILTNKHVVRPDAGESIDERKQAREEREQQLRTLKASLEESRRQLGLMKRDLDGYGDLIAKAPNEKTRTWAQDAQGRLSQRYRTERDRIAGTERSIRAIQADLRSSEQALSLARSRNQFDIVLKDGTELTAILLATSEDRDLALLELNGDYHTPFIRLDLSQTLSQGTPVFAIGEPLGMQDTVTAGVVAQITPNDLLTDAQVLPGSSGGPLIRESGEVIGINVSRKVAAGTSKYAAGFGKAIPIALAVQAFPSLSTLIETRDVAEATSGLPGPNPVRQIPTRPQATETRPKRQAGYSSRSANLGQGSIGSFDSVPARLILPNENAARDLGEPSQADSHSLDFPPEGGGTVFSGRK